MNARIIGVVLIVLGAIGLIFKGIDYTRQETIVEIGPVQASAETTETIPVPTWAAVTVLGLGVLVLLVAKPRSS